MDQRRRIIKEIFNKKEGFFRNNADSEYRNKPNRGKMEDIEKRKQSKTPNRGNHSQSRSRSELEILTTADIKVKALKGLYFRQEITKIEAQDITSRIMVKNVIKRKETFFVV